MIFCCLTISIISQFLNLVFLFPLLPIYCNSTARDIKISLELDLRSIDKSIDEIYVKKKKKNLTLKQRLDLQERLSELEPKRKELRMKIYDEQDKIDDERKKLIEEIKKKLILKTESKKLFTIEWKII